jgi:hypothetical protein
MNTNQIPRFTKIDADGLIGYDFSTSSMAENRQFLYQLVSLVRPHNVVELGTYYGCSYFAMAQAIKNEQLTTRLVGVDTWAGDDDVGRYGEDVFRDFLMCHKPYPPRNCTYLRTTFDDARDTFRDKTIDLLMVDGAHDYASVKRDFEGYLPKLNPEGIVLFHDTKVGKFGVSQFLAEIKASGKFNVFNFDNQYGLAVVTYKDAFVWHEIQPLLYNPRRLIYTANFGGKDALAPTLPQSIPCDYFCFTDSAPAGGRMNGWALINKIGSDDPRLTAKMYKVRPDTIPELKGYDQLIWVDAHVQIKHPDFARYMTNALGPNAAVFFKHPHRGTVAEEVAECIAQGKYHGKPDHLLQRYHRVQDNLLLAGTVFARDMRHPKAATLGIEWMDNIIRYSIRDQLTLPLVIKKYKIGYTKLDLNIYNNPYFNYLDHIK